MYKEIIISVIVVVAIIGIDLIAQQNTKNNIGFIISELEELKENIKKEDKEKVNEKMDMLNSEWEEIYNKMAIYIEHDELEKVKTNMVALEGFIEVEDYETGINELNKSVYVLQHIAEKYDFSIVNVF